MHNELARHTHSRTRLHAHTHTLTHSTRWRLLSRPEFKEHVRMTITTAIIVFIGISACGISECVSVSTHTHTHVFDKFVATLSARHA